jgi:hypothetical protein
LDTIYLKPSASTQPDRVADTGPFPSSQPSVFDLSIRTPRQFRAFTDAHFERRVE